MPPNENDIPGNNPNPELNDQFIPFAFPPKPGPKKGSKKKPGPVGRCCRGGGARCGGGLEEDDDDGSVEGSSRGSCRSLPFVKTGIILSRVRPPLQTGQDCAVGEVDSSH